ncbi:AAA family ATPase [Lactobacillus sp. ESL0785]|uniref:ATP-binding protein n=1 Tax=Lactobacillus sp. ESL0785 TaxID=2983232 RepID=UPI0023F760EB|nr:AAA family ATPase [Lactobacillus sp. ESL0785]WEV70442.1 AAA family ATPase [Lactobacillus sp. ESL0785]
MKLIKIKIVNFGQFSNVTFTLPNSDLNVFFGANEAGKSTVVAFIKQVLFGFYLQKRATDFFEDYAPLARVSPMGGSLFFENDQGEQYELERLYAKGKGSKLGTLTVKCNNQVVPASIFFDQIKNITGDFYADSFIFNQDMLAKVIKIKQTDLLERIYYLGAANSDQLIAMRDDFNKKADTLFKSRGTVPPVNQLLTQLKQQKGKLAAAEMEFSDYKVLNETYTEKQHQQADSERNLQQLQTELGELERLQKLVPSYQKLQSLKAQIKEVKFDQQQYQTAQKLNLQKQSLQQAIDSLKKRLEQITEKPVDFAAATKISQKKPELLQWRSEYHHCQQQEEQITTDEQQLLALNPKLAQIAKLGQTEVIQLQEEYQKLPEDKLETPTATNSSTSKLLLMAGVGILVAGLILLLTVSKVGGVVLIICGLIGVFAVLSRQKQEKVQQIAVQKQKAAVKQQRAQFAHQYGLDPDKLDLPTLINQWRQLQSCQQKRQTNQEQEATLLEKVENLAGQVSQLLQRHVTSDFAAVLAALDSLTEVITKVQQSQEAKQNLQANLTAKQTNLHEIDLQLTAKFAVAGVTTMSDYEKRQLKAQQQAQLKAQAAALSANLTQDLPQLTTLLQDQKQVGFRKQKLQQKISDLQRELQQLQSAIAEIKVKMKNLANSTAVFAAKQELANTQTEFRKQSVQYFANLLTAQWLSRTLDLASNERFPKMVSAAQNYLQLLTNNRYNKINIDKSLSVIRDDGKKIKVEYLSRGTQEQLYFALKLAFVQQIKDQINLPLLIDDSFVNFDDQRTEQIEQLLRQIAQGNQVLIFTAQTKLVDQLKLQPLTFTKGTENV